MDQDDPFFDPVFRDKKARLEFRASRQLRMLETFPKSRSKPDRYMFDVIRQRFGDARYVAMGDSISKDLAPAFEAGMETVWARYGASVEPKSLETILNITPWSETEIEFHGVKNYQPDNTIDRPSQLLTLLLSKQALQMASKVIEDEDAALKAMEDKRNAPSSQKDLFG